MKKTLIALAILTLAGPLASMAGPDDPVSQQQGAAQSQCPMMGSGMQRGCGQNMGPGMGPCMGMEMGGPGRRGHGGRGPECITEMAKELELTEQQITKIRMLQHDFQLQQIDRRAEIDKAQLAMRELKRNDKSSESEVLAHIEKLGQLRTQQQKAMYSHHRAMLNVLTEEQRTKLKELRADAFDDDDEDMPGHGQGMGQGDRRGK